MKLVVRAAAAAACRVLRGPAPTPSPLRGFPLTLSNAPPHRAGAGCPGPPLYLEPNDTPSPPPPPPQPPPQPRSRRRIPPAASPPPRLRLRRSNDALAGCCCTTWRTECSADQRTFPGLGPPDNEAQHDLVQPGGDKLAQVLHKADKVFEQGAHPQPADCPGRPGTALPRRAAVPCVRSPAARIAAAHRATPDAAPAFASQQCSQRAPSATHVRAVTVVVAAAAARAASADPQ